MCGRSGASSGGMDHFATLPLLVELQGVRANAEVESSIGAEPTGGYELFETIANIGAALAESHARHLLLRNTLGVRERAWRLDAHLEQPGDVLGVLALDLGQQVLRQDSDFAPLRLRKQEADLPLARDGGESLVITGPLRPALGEVERAQVQGQQLRMQRHDVGGALDALVDDPLQKGARLCQFPVVVAVAAALADLGAFRGVVCERPAVERRNWAGNLLHHGVKRDATGKGRRLGAIYVSAEKCSASFCARTHTHTHVRRTI